MKNINLLILVFIIFINTVISAQNIGGKITYAVNFEYDQKKLDSIKNINPFVYNTFKNQKQKKYILIYDNEISVSFLEKKMKRDEDHNMLDYISILLGSDSKYYTSNHQNIIEKEFSENRYLIKESFLDWELKNIKKKIGNYDAYKATANLEIETRDGRKLRTIEAWYTTQLPVKYGPKGYSGLPGLILELKEGNGLFFNAIKIELNNSENKIEFPIKGKEISKEEFNKIVKKSIPKFN